MSSRRRSAIPVRLLSASALAFGAFASASAAHAQCPTWQEGFHAPGFGNPTPSSSVSAFVGATGGSGALILGGDRLQAPGIPLPGAAVVRWDGVNAEALGTLSAQATVDDLVRFDDGTGEAIYAGGSFGPSALRGVARWDGAAWQALGNGLDGHVRALAVYDDGGGAALYAGGDFLTSAGTPMPYVARWRGGAWSRVGAGASDGPDSYVWALEVWDDGNGPALYAGGSFQGIGTGAARRVAKWDGTSWSAVGVGLGTTTGTVKALEAHDDGSGSKLYAGGSFTTDGAGTAMRAFARFGGSAWTAVGGSFTGSGLTCEVRAIRGGVVAGASDLYVTGVFIAAGSTAATDAAAWNGTAWRALGSGVSGHALHVHDFGSGGELYVGGAFDSAGGTPARRVARWNGSAWSSVHNGDGFDRSATAAVVHDDGSGPALYVGGPMSFAGTTPVRGVARRDGAAWTALGASTGPACWVFALASHDDGSGRALYAGGDFTQIGGFAVPWIARWNGSAWSPVGTPWPSINTWLRALVEFDDGSGLALYAAGSFSSIGGVSASNVARWNGSAWTPLGLGVNGPVYALAVHDDGTGPALYAGGEFTNAGGGNAARIARWNGSTWSPVGTGVSAVRVKALHVHDDGAGAKLYLGGGFVSAGGAPGTNRLARWTGTAFEAVGTPPVLDQVFTFASFDDGTGRGSELYVGGQVLSGGSPNLVRFDGASWSGVQVGLDGQVDVLRVHDAGAGPALHAMGEFSTAGASTYATTFAALSSCGETGRTLCFGDGSGAACPCGNESAIGDRDGCRSSLGSGGRLRAAGTPSLAADDVVLAGSQMPNSTVLYFQGSARIGGGAGVAFGDGLRCAGGSVVRIALETNVANASSYPVPGDVALATRGGVTQPGARVYQAWYRNAAAFCTSSTFNLTNAVEIVWTR